MAKNLREKLPSDDTLIVQDINKDASRKFADELKAFQVVVADTARELAEKSVCALLLFTKHLELPDDFISFKYLHDLSWELRATLSVI